MTNKTSEKICPDPRVLVDFLQGKLVPPELENCESHLESCDVCQETLSGINASDTLSEVVAKALAPQCPSTDDAEVVQSLVQRLGNPADFTITQSDVSSKELLRDRAAEVLLHVSPDPDDDQSLGLLAGFRLKELLGSGGTGVVFRAYDLALDREIALKVLQPSLGDLARDRFVAEARAAASIDHENVVAIYQVGQQDRLAWIAMKWVSGETLESRLLREDSLAEDEVRQLAIQIAKGLTEAHRQQLVHRDIKPANVWIGDADGKVLILDFGLVRITDNDPALTATGMLAGTPNFMSPEQAKGQELDARSDLFSLGCVMYQMITGTLPFGSPTILATLQSIQTQQPEPPVLFADDCSDELSNLTMALLEKQPANRVDSAESLVRCLETPRSEWPANIKRCVASRHESDKNVQKATATSTRGGRFGAGTLIGAVLLGLFGFGLWLFAHQIIRIATNQGELVIETDDKDVQVTVSEDGERVRVLDASSGAAFDVRSGEFKISAVGNDGKTEFEVLPNQLTLHRGGREVVKVTRKQNAASRKKSSTAQSQNMNQGISDDNSATDANRQSELVYRGKQLNEWLEILKVDQDAQTQADALNACAVLYLSNGQTDELMDTLEQYIERYRTTFRGDERTTYVSGFNEALWKFGTPKITEFFERQLRQGSDSSIGWAFRGMTKRRAPNYPNLKKLLKSKSDVLLRLIADRDKSESVGYLLDFVCAHLLEDPVSDESLGLIKNILARLSIDDFLESAKYLPKQLVTPELFAPVKARLFATETSPAERDNLVKGLNDVQNHWKGQASFLLEIFAEVIANQMYASDKIEFENLQRLSVLEIGNPSSFYLSTISDGRSIEIEGHDVVVRKLLTAICEKTLSAKPAETALLSRQAEKVLAAIIDRSSKELIIDTSALRRHRALKIDFDITQLIKRSKGQAGMFSVFVYRQFGKEKRTFRADPAVVRDTKTNKAATALAPSTANKSQFDEIEDFITGYFARHDNDKNGILEGDELSGVTDRSISRYDTNRDGKIESNEMLNALSPDNIQLSRATSQKKNHNDQSIGLDSDEQSRLLYRSKKLSEWLRILKSDLAATTQAEALRACAAIYSSAGHQDELLPLLESYIQRNKDLFRGDQKTACVSGFEDALRKLSPQKIVEFFKLQLKQGTPESIRWTLRGMTYSPSRDSIPALSSGKILEDLQANATELLSLIAARDDGEDVAYLLNFVSTRLLKEPVSDAQIKSIKTILAKLSAYDLVNSAKYVPKQLLTPTYFTPVMAELLSSDSSDESDIKRLLFIQDLVKVEMNSKGQVSFLSKILESNASNFLRVTAKREKVGSLLLFDYIVKNLISNPASDDQINAIREVLLKVSIEELFKAADKVPTRVLTPELFASVKARLFSDNTDARERDYLIMSLIDVERQAKGKASFILETLAEVIANQMYAPTRIEFDKWQTMTVTVDTENPKNEYVVSPHSSDSYRAPRYKRVELNGGAVVVRKVLDKIFQRLLDKDTPSPRKMAKRIVEILAKPASNQKNVKPVELQYFNKLGVDDDLVTIREFSKDQAGKFKLSKFGYPTTKRFPCVIEEKDFDTWLHIAKIQNPVDVQIKAINACFALNESDQDFAKLIKLVRQLSDTYPVYETNSDGTLKPLQQDWSRNLFLQGFNNFSAEQAVSYVISQFPLYGREKGDRQAVFNAVFALEKWSDGKKLRQQQLLKLFKPRAVSYLKVAKKLKKPHPAAFTKFINMLESLNAPPAKTNNNNQQPAIDKEEPLSANDNPKQDMDLSGNSADLSKLVYRGKKLSEWLKVLENDQDPKTQAEAIKACATLYESIGQIDIIEALLKSYVKRHASDRDFLQNPDEVAGFLGFKEALKKLPPKSVVDFFKYQLKQGDEITIAWAYLGILKTKDPRQLSIFTKLQVYSPELDKELKSNAINLLHLIAARDNVDPYDYLLIFVVENLLKDQVTDDAIAAIRELIVKFEPKVLLKVANRVPVSVLDEQLFASVRTRLFAADTKAAERDELIKGLIKIEKRAKGKASFILETLAEVIANQMYAHERIEFDELQKMKVNAAKNPNEKGEFSRASIWFIPKGFKVLEIKGSAVVARTLLDGICERLLAKDTTAPAEIAKKISLILSEASSNKNAIDPSKLEHFNQLKINLDLEELKKLSNEKSGEFSDFIDGKRKF